MKLPIAMATLVMALSPLVSALGKGEFCFFLAPKELGGLGHIAWGFLIGGTTTYQYGGTEDTWYGSSWTSQGSKSAMLHDFKVTIPNKFGNHYQYYKCMPTDTSAVGAAEKVVQYQQTPENKYDALGNNCLQQSLNIAMAYADHDVYQEIVKLIGPNNPDAYFVPGVFWLSVPATEQTL